MALRADIGRGEMVRFLDKHFEAPSVVADRERERDADRQPDRNVDASSVLALLDARGRWDLGLLWRGRILLD